MGSKVYWMNARSESPETSLPAKMLTVFDAAGLGDMIVPGDVVAIKVHCGEWNNSAYLRPVYARTLADRVKSLGGRPFVCDTTTQTYSPFCSRATELDILITAERNGFASATLGCPFICADGFVGNSDYRVDIPEGYLLKEAYIAQAIAAADVLLCLTHFKGHGMGVIGGSIKNLGIGCQSKRGKFNVHMGGHPKYSLPNAAVFHPEAFKGKKEDANWKMIEDSCPFDALHVTDDERVVWEKHKCTNCLGCMGQLMPRGLIEFPLAMFEATQISIADAALGAVKAVGKGKVGFINMALDVSPVCDCAGFADLPVVPHLGVFASRDPIAIDLACVEIAKKTPGTPGSHSEELDHHHIGDTKFEGVSTMVEGLSEETQINVGVAIGLGSRDYELVEVPKGDPVAFRFPPDPRPTGVKFKAKFAKLGDIFPYDKYNGQGYKREPEVDLQAPKHAVPPHNGHKPNKVGAGRKAKI
ncbi:MAG: DUF362 domain-containing protein [Chloroflexota bacterium]|nr:DUF362 domain-containing protein [Chloroflexota bacterium]